MSHGDEAGHRSSLAETIGARNATIEHAETAWHPRITLTCTEFPGGLHVNCGMRLPIRVT